MAFDRLPWEIVEHVVSFLAPESTSQDYCRLALVGRPVLLDLARIQLYRSLNFRHAWTKQRLELFNRTIKETHLGLLTQELHLGLDAPVDESELYEKNVMLNLLCALPNIQILRIGNGALKLAPALKKEPQALKNVRTLRIDYQIDAKPTRLRNFCSNLPALQDLSIKILASQKPPQIPARIESLDHSLQRLSIVQDRGARPAPFELLMRLFEHRQELYIHAVHVCTYAQLPPRYPTMRVFGLPSPNLISSFELFVHSAIPPFLDQLTHLKAFTLVFVPKSGIIDPTVLDRIVAEGLFPISIERLELRYQGYQSDLLPDCIEVKKRSPRLKYIKLDFRLGDKEAQRNMGQELHKMGVKMDINYNVF